MVTVVFYCEVLIKTDLYAIKLKYIIDLETAKLLSDQWNQSTLHLLHCSTPEQQCLQTVHLQLLCNKEKKEISLPL